MIPAREVEPTAAYRLGKIKVGEWRSTSKVTGQDNLQCPSDPQEMLA
jgi:hypothetical protein